MRKFVASGWPVGPDDAKKKRVDSWHAIQGVALRWMNGWAFGPKCHPRNT